MCSPKRTILFIICLKNDQNFNFSIKINYIVVLRLLTHCHEKSNSILGSFSSILMAIFLITFWVLKVIKMFKYITKMMLRHCACGGGLEVCAPEKLFLNCAI